MEYTIVDYGLREFAIFRGDDVNPIDVFGGYDGLEQAREMLNELNSNQPTDRTRFGLID